MALDSVEQLLAPMSWDSFLRDHHGRNHVHIRGSQERACGVASWAELNVALAAHRRPRASITVTRAGQVVEVPRTTLDTRRQPGYEPDVAEFYRQLRAGNTLALHAADEMIPAVGVLADALRARFGSAQASLCASWSEGDRGPHFDGDELFVLHLSGRKRWRIYGATDPCPTARDASLGRLLPAPTAVVDEVVLRPGDVLYLPRGHWHDVCGSGEPSLHAAFGIEHPTGLGLLEWVAGQMSSGDMFEQVDPRFASDDERRSTMQQLRDLLISELDDDVLDRFFASRDAKARAGLSLPHAVVGDGLPAGDQFVVIPDFAVPPTVRTRGTEVGFAAAGREWVWECSREPLVRLLVASRPWRFDELVAASGVDAGHTRELLGDLVAAGLVRVIP